MPMPISVWINAFSGRKSPPVNSVRSTATSLQNGEEMKQIMRWAGPRMLWRHPILTVRHLMDDRRPVPELPEKYRPKK